MNHRVLIAAPGSGTGKTTVTLALLAACRQLGLDTASFKCGPDYIDPMFHREVAQVACHNLDPYFCGPETLRSLFAQRAGRDISVIEGVMGYYDGIGAEGRASTYDVGRALEAPVILVVNTKGMSTSLGALLQGFASFRPESNIRGVIFNNLKEGMYPLMKQIAANAGVPALGFLPPCPELAIESRHLGLVTAAEIDDLQEKLARLGELARAHIDMDALLQLAKEAPELPAAAAGMASDQESSHQESSARESSCPGCSASAPELRPRIAVSDDKAFCFMYQENREMLEDLGCEPVPFSPLTDSALPEGCAGLYLCGGYPELYTKELSANHSMLESIRAAIRSGMPTIAECGGYMYLHDSIEGVPMAGIFPGDVTKADRLQNFGYEELTAARDSLLLKKGESIRVHEFHYYKPETEGDAFVSAKASSGRSHSCGYSSPSLYAAFPHIYLPAGGDAAARYAQAAADYALRRKESEG